ncbi:MAG TPA: hypothetical protein VII55_03470 [Candidatus Saccharimonadales bacterium]
MAGLHEEIEFEGHTLFVKDEFHITLVAAKYLAEMISPNKQAPVINQILLEFDKFTATTPLDKYELSGNLRFAQVGEQKTIILMAKVPNLDQLFEQLSQQFSVELPKQQTHVTLYRYPKDFIGIPIPSPKILEDSSKSIDIPELSLRCNDHFHQRQY